MFERILVPLDGSPCTHGRTGIGRWVYGSVTEKVLRSIESAMLIVRPDDLANDLDNGGI